jgi:hypothetical protein
MAKPRTTTKSKSRTEERAELEQQLFMQDVERVRKLLIRKKAEDLIPMILIELSDYRTITKLTMPLGATK